MTAMEWLLWGSICWTVWLAYCALDVPDLCARVAHLISDRIRHGGAR